MYIIEHLKLTLKLEVFAHMTYVVNEQKQLPCAPVLLLKIIIVQQNVSLGRICLKSAESNLIKNFFKKFLNLT